MSEFGNIFDLSCSLGQTSEDRTNIGSVLHRDDSELILLIDPHKERLLVVMEDSSALWPVTVEATGFKESITLFE